jgi:hypothetical protein
VRSQSLEKFRDLVEHFFGILFRFTLLLWERTSFNRLKSFDCFFERLVLFSFKGSVRNTGRFIQAQ